MIYLITALDAEARPLIEHYRLKRDHTLPYTLYRGEETLLLVTQAGKSNAMMATSALLGWRLPRPGDILINVGICGAPEEHPLGEPLLIHQIIDGERRYYPDILYPHTMRESPLLCLDTPAEGMENALPVDMESGGVYSAAARFFKLHRLAFLKIVSDHFEPETVTKEGAIELIRSCLPQLDALIAALRSAASEAPLFTPEEEEAIEGWKGHFTAAQGVRLDDALCYFRLQYPQRPLPALARDIPPSKRERSTLLETFIAGLTA